MAPPSKISKLPKDLLDELNARIIGNGFADYDGLSVWLVGKLQQRGMQMVISRSAIHRAGQKLEKIGDRVKAMQMMQSGWQKQMGNRGIGELGRVLNAQLQGLAFTLTQDAIDGEVMIDAEFLKDMSVTLMRLEKSSAINEDRDQKIREEERQRATSEAAEKVDVIAKKKGLNKETADAIRRSILGMPDQ